MRCPAEKDQLDNSDRKKVRRIFYQIIGIYMSLLVIAIGGVAVRSVFAVWPNAGLGHKTYSD